MYRRFSRTLEVKRPGCLFSGFHSSLKCLSRRSFRVKKVLDRTMASKQVPVTPEELIAAEAVLARAKAAGIQAGSSSGQGGMSDSANRLHDVRDAELGEQWEPAQYIEDPLCVTKEHMEKQKNTSQLPAQPMF